MVGIILVLYITAWIGGARKWTRKLNTVRLITSAALALTSQTNFSFYVISTLVTWASFGMAIRIPLIANDNLKGYNETTSPSDLAPLNARAGNATWLILTGAVSSFGSLRFENRLTL